METTLYAFVRRHSFGAQLMLLAVTVATFPLLYATLELPKLIINDAIDPAGPRPTLGGRALTQVEHLGLLCLAFLAATLAWGFVKMRLNTLRGRLAERLMRRFRYALISAALRFPLPEYRRSGPGEIIATITAEAEPLGGVMGDALAQPAFQAGQMLTILGFLVVQSPWLGLAAAALIPLQAWLIPVMQRRVNRLQRVRIAEMRRFSQEIAEGVAGAEELRAHGGAPFALAVYGRRLTRLMDARFAIFQAKYLMKFVNNLITQITPLLFFAIGGLLVIRGELSLGALVAALAAHRELSAPWRELLAFYNQASEMSQRYEGIVARFSPPDAIPAALIEGRPEAMPRLNGPIRFEGVTVSEAGGATVLDDVDMEIPAGAMAAIRSRSAAERRAVDQLLSRTIMPDRGRVTINGVDLAGLHQSAIAARVGVAGPRPRLFDASVARNVQMPLRLGPRGVDPAAARAAAAEGVSADPVEAEWLDPAIAGVEDLEGLRDWWIAVLDAEGAGDFLFRRGLDDRFPAARHADLAARVVALRADYAARLAEAGLARALHPFDPLAFNPGLAVGENLLFAVRRKPAAADAIAQDPRFLPGVRALGLEDELFAMGRAVAALLVRVFGPVGAAHPLYRRLGLDEDLLARLRALDRRARDGRLDEADRALALALPFRLSAEEIGRAFPARLRNRILALRADRAAQLRALAADVFEPLDAAVWVEGLTLFENLAFGRLTRDAGEAGTAARELALRVLDEAGLRADVALLIGDVAAGPGGANLPQLAHERIAFARAAIRRPDVLVLDQALASLDAASREATRRRVRRLLPEATIVFLEPEIMSPGEFDVVLDLDGGRLAGRAEPAADPGEDLSRKMRALETHALFAALDRAQLRLLAFAADWFEAPADTLLFEAGAESDAAYLLTEGRAVFVYADGTPARQPIGEVGPGRLIGDLSVIRGAPRHRALRALTPLRGLRIGAAEFRAVVEADQQVALALLRTVAGHLVAATGKIEAMTVGRS